MIYFTFALTSNLVFRDSSLSLVAMTKLSTQLCPLLPSKWRLRFTYMSKKTYNPFSRGNSLQKCNLYAFCKKNMQIEISK